MQDEEKEKKENNTKNYEQVFKQFKEQKIVLEKAKQQLI